MSNQPSLSLWETKKNDIDKIGKRDQKPRVLDSILMWPNQILRFLVIFYLKTYNL